MLMCVFTTPQPCIVYYTRTYSVLLEAVAAIAGPTEQARLIQLQPGILRSTVCHVTGRRVFPYL